MSLTPAQGMWLGKPMGLGASARGAEQAWPYGRAFSKNPKAPSHPTLSK